MNQTLKTRKPKVIILVGPPCSGKSTWSAYYDNSRLPNNGHCVIVSRDIIRKDLFGKNIYYSYSQERKVNDIEDSQITAAISQGHDIIWDNTHCRAIYLNQAISRFENEDYFVEVRFFNAPYKTLRRRNFWRYLRTGRWIPRKVTKTFQEGYDEVTMHWFGGSSLEIHNLYFHKGYRIDINTTVKYEKESNTEQTEPKEADIGNFNNTSEHGSKRRGYLPQMCFLGGTIFLWCILRLPF